MEHAERVAGVSNEPRVGIEPDEVIVVESGGGFAKETEFEEVVGGIEVFDEMGDGTFDGAIGPNVEVFEDAYISSGLDHALHHD